MSLKILYWNYINYLNFRIKKEVPDSDLKNSIEVIESTLLAVLDKTCLTHNLNYDIKDWKDQWMSKHKMANIKINMQVFFKQP